MQNKPEISVSSGWALCFLCFHPILKKKKEKNKENKKRNRPAQRKTLLNV